VVATSATLSLGGSFRHAAGQLGLTWLAGSPGRRRRGARRARPGAVAEALAGDEEDPPPRWKHLDVGQPVRLPAQSQLWIARDLPDPAGWRCPGRRRSTSCWSSWSPPPAAARSGLFSSTAAAARAAAAVREATDLPILLQGDDSPGALQHRFASDARTCLFGTASFWQGVDTPAAPASWWSSTASRSGTWTTRCPRPAWPPPATPAATASWRSPCRRRRCCWPRAPVA
jgi:ATP-dependent DNA helicase DinG